MSSRRQRLNPPTPNRGYGSPHAKHGVDPTPPPPQHHVFDRFAAEAARPTQGRTLDASRIETALVMLGDIMNAHLDGVEAFKKVIETRLTAIESTLALVVSALEKEKETIKPEVDVPKKPVLVSVENE